MIKHLKITYARKKIVAFILVLSMARTVQCQDPPRPEIDISAFIQNLFPAPTEDADHSDLYESLFQLYANPLDLNTVTQDELNATFILSETQVQSLFEYRRKLGAFLSLYELQAVPGFDLNTIYKLLPFVTVQPRPLSFRESLQNPTQHFLMLRSGRLIEEQKGFTEIDSNSASRTRYAGPPWYGYLRYRNARTGVFSFGITMEKDAGETLWKWKRKQQIYGTDFSSFHAQIMNRGRLKNLIIGDYQMQAGQGLIMAAGFSLGKGSEVIKTTYRSTLGLKPYTSVLEANYFRGVAATLTLNKHTDITGFYSRTKRDATQDEIDDETITTSLPISGYHRTPSEREKHNILLEQNAGLHILYKIPSQKGQIGVTVLYTNYNSTIRKKDVPYNRYEFSGEQNLTAGVHGDYRWRNLHFFGEGGRSRSGGLGGIGGVIASLGKSFDFSFLARGYDRNFHTCYGNSLSEATKPINESGAYFGLRFFSNRRWQFSVFYDRFKFPWLKYQVDAPSRGHDYYLHLLWKPNKRFNMYALFHEKHKQRNNPDSKLPSLPLVTSARRTFIINVEYEVPLRFSTRTRIQYGDLVYLKISKSKGFTAAQDITWHLKKFEVSARLAYFKTDDYDSRQYVYEKDMLYAFSVPAYYDAGTRHYLMGRYAITKKMKIWVRWSQTRYSNLEKISSGLNEIQGNKRSEIKAQVMYQF
jgi:hypothetical protein